jgi:alpha-galactosidase
MPKIALIGAGSVVFARRLMADILSFPELQDCTISLMDIDAGRLDMIRQLADLMVEQHGLPTRVEATQDRRRALDGADYVIIMFQVGGLAMYQQDVLIPRRYGIDQTVGDTLGPGGVFRGLRTVPVLLDLCRDMQELCPNALLINYANPMAINCWAVSEATSIRNVGLCHSVQGTSEQLARYIGVPYDEVSYWVAGINHMAWFLEFRRGEEDLYPRLREVANDPTFDRDRVRFEVMRQFGYFVTESSHHMSEYLPYFRQSPGLIMQFDSPRWDYLDLCMNLWQKHYAQIESEIADRTVVPLERSHEYGAFIIHGLETGTPYRINGNVANTGLITNLPQGSCVEVPCLVDASGLRPCHVGDLPEQLAALNRTNINVQALAVRAALTGDREAAFHAVALDPLTSAMLDLRRIRQMVDELFEAEKDYLPQFA